MKNKAITIVNIIKETCSKIFIVQYYKYEDSFKLKLPIKIIQNKKWVLGF